MGPLFLRFKSSRAGRAPLRAAFSPLLSTFTTTPDEDSDEGDEGSGNENEMVPAPLIASSWARLTGTTSRALAMSPMTGLSKDFSAIK